MHACIAGRRCSRRLVAASRRRRRHRSPRPASLSLRQIEFYFSDSNLPRDKFLSETVAADPEGYVDVALLCIFSRVRALLKSTVTDAAKVCGRAVPAQRQEGQHLGCALQPLHAGCLFAACRLQHGRCTMRRLVGTWGCWQSDPAEPRASASCRRSPSKPWLTWARRWPPVRR